MKKLILLGMMSLSLGSATIAQAATSNSFPIMLDSNTQNMSETTTPDSIYTGGFPNGKSAFYLMLGRGSDFNSSTIDDAGTAIGLGAEAWITPDMALQFDLAKLGFNTDQGFGGERLADHDRISFKAGLRFYVFPEEWPIQPFFGGGFAYHLDSVEDENPPPNGLYDPNEKISVDRFSGSLSTGADFIYMNRFSMGLEFNYFMVFGNRDGVNDGPGRNPQFLTFENNNFYRANLLARYHF